MNFFDVFVISVIAVFAIVGFWKGFIAQLFNAAGIFCAFYFNTTLSTFLAERFSDEPDSIVRILTATASFFIIFSIFCISGWLVSKTVNFAIASLPNRAAGIVFGAVNGFLTVTLIFVIIRLFAQGDPFLRKHVTPDRGTDEIIKKAVSLASDKILPAEADNEAPDSEDEKTRTYSRIGYAAYRISTLMDPFIENVRSVAKKKYDEVIEEKITY